MKLILLTLLAAASIARADTLTENFTTDPAADGWQLFGDASLFTWDSTNHDLAVLWDSSQPNSYFYHSLPMTLTRADDFSVAFDLRLLDVASGTTPGKPSIFEIAVGFLNLADATQTNFFRGAGTEAGGPVNLVEFNYFPDFIDPDSGKNYGATIGPNVISSDNAFNYDGDTYSVDLSLDLATNVLYHILMSYTAANQTLVTLMTADGQPFGPINDVYLPDAFAPDEDFQVDQISVSSYSDGGQDPMYPEGSIRAHGTVSNFVVTTPPPVAGVTGSFNGSAWQAQFRGRPNWLYTLERSVDLQSWNTVSSAVPGNVATFTTLQDTNPPAGYAYYRIHGSQP